MGRIADALKRAEEERRQTLQVGASAPGLGTALLDPPRRECAPAWVKEPGQKPSPEPSCEPLPVVDGLSDSLVPFFERSSLATEQYRSLRTRLFSQNPNYEHRVLAITSAIPKEGKSVTTLNLGCVMAEIRHLNILVVDGDFRRSSLARMLNQPDGPGLAEVLRGSATFDEVLRDTPVPNLKFLPAGDTKDHSAAELLTAASAAPAFRRMKNDFHCTIVDTPPATTVPDVGIIGQMCSGVIVIVRLHRTAEAAARRAVRLLQVNNIPIVGAVVIGRDAPASRYYGYGHGYYFGQAYNYYRYYDRYKYPDRGD